MKRLITLIKGLFSQLVGNIERKNPKALLEVEKENLRTQIAKYNQGLASHAGLCERLVTQVKRERTEVDQLTEKVRAHLKAGNRKLAGEYAFRLQKVKEELEDNRNQLTEVEKTYEELKRARDTTVREAKEKLKSLERTIDETQVAQATAELNEMASGMIGEIGGAGDNLNRLEEMINEEREEAKGRSRVSRDALDTTDLKEMEAERSALEEMALADFAAESGVVIDQPEPEQAVTKTKEM